MSEQAIYTSADDVNGDTMIDVWSNGVGDLHVLILNMDTQERQMVYLRNGEALGKAILKELWK